MIAHIVKIERAGHIEGYQLRHDGGSRYFATRKLGGIAQARFHALKTAEHLGLTLRTYAGHSVEGISWRWFVRPTGTVLYAVASYTAPDGRRHITQYSTQKHGLAGALDLAIFARESAGHKVKGRRALLEALQTEFETGAKNG